MKTVLKLTAVLEAGTGIGLLTVPSVLAGLLLGAPLEAPAALTVARVGGAALLAIGVACWLASSDTQSCAARGVVTAMVIYNLGAALVLGAAGIQSPPPGIALWPAVILHAAMATQLGILIKASTMQWKDVEPAIFGTLLERALDPEERHQLGAHYTPRAYVERPRGRAFSHRRIRRLRQVTRTGGPTKLRPLHAHD